MVIRSLACSVSVPQVEVAAIMTQVMEFNEPAPDLFFTAEQARTVRLFG
ncbi:MAG: hypothetical protein U1B80_00175 [Anaerolineaceae bacterium]|nr:hypothetical protein [Anaerolineaceae bacterium]